uniref:CSON007099 protein n=1 Tax=Culicoides sonorensis TaxID=179676 RepID=A0A336M995_CULSO
MPAYGDDGTQVKSEKSGIDCGGLEGGIGSGAGAANYIQFSACPQYDPSKPQAVLSSSLSLKLHSAYMEFPVHQMVYKGNHGICVFCQVLNYSRD